MPRWWDRFLGRSFEPQEEQRAITVPFNVGEPLTQSAPVTEERALHLTPVYAAVRHLADHISTLPLKAYRRVGQDERRPMDNLPQLFQFLEEDGTLVDWLCRCVTSLAMQGNAIGVITSRDGFQYPTSVAWRPRSEFYVDDHDENPGRSPDWYWLGRYIERSELVHIPWITVPGRTLGLSPIEYYALTVAGGLSAQQYGDRWFAAGGVPPGTFKNSEKIVPQGEADQIKARLVSAIRTGQPIVYGADWDFEAIAIPPEQAQFVETQKLTANQIASIYGIEPEEVGGVPANSLTYTNDEMRTIRRVGNLRPWLVRMESGFSAVLPERQYVKLSADATVRGDIKTRYESYQIASEIGLLTNDEMRALEDRQPLPPGAIPKPVAPPVPGEPAKPLRIVNG